MDTTMEGFYDPHLRKPHLCPFLVALPAGVALKGPDLVFMAKGGKLASSQAKLISIGPIPGVNCL
jgi:hypothetical protein